MAYENETDGFTAGNLHIKNALDTITIEGTLEITKDRVLKPHSNSNEQ
jgi:hypothetical protein